MFSGCFQRDFGGFFRGGLFVKALWRKGDRDERRGEI